MTYKGWWAAAAMLLVLWPAAAGVNAAAQEAPPAGPGETPLSAPKHPIAQCLFDNINGARAAQGVPAVTEHPVLSNLAQGHSDAMAAQGSLHHSSPDIFGLLPRGWRSFGEDVVPGTSCEQMWTALETSQPHMDIIVRPDFNSVGTAVATGEDGWTYATLMFLDAPAPLVQPAPVVPASPAPPPPPSPPAPPPPPGAPPAAPLPPIVAEPPTITLDGSDATGGPLPSFIAPESTSPDGGAGRSSRRGMAGVAGNGRSVPAAEGVLPAAPGEATGAVLFRLEETGGVLFTLEEEKDEIVFDLEYQPAPPVEEETPPVHFSIEGR